VLTGRSEVDVDRQRFPEGSVFVLHCGDPTIRVHGPKIIHGQLALIKLNRKDLIVKIEFTQRPYGPVSPSIDLPYNFIIKKLSRGRVLH
jgi:hypothetical protein